MPTQCAPPPPALPRRRRMPYVSWVSKSGQVLVAAPPANRYICAFPDPPLPESHAGSVYLSAARRRRSRRISVGCGGGTKGICLNLSEQTEGGVRVCECGGNPELCSSLCSSSRGGAKETCIRHSLQIMKYVSLPLIPRPPSTPSPPPPQLLHYRNPLAYT